MYVRTKVYVGLKMNFRAMLTITKKIKQIVGTTMSLADGLCYIEAHASTSATAYLLN